MSKRLRPLSGLDASFLYLEASGTPMHVGSIMLLEAPRKRGYNFHRAMMNLLAERLPRAPALRRVIQEAPLDLGHPMWAEARNIDLDFHILKLRLPAPGDQQQLMDLVARLHEEQLPRDRPLWQFAVIEGLATGELAFYSKIHHALLDGQGGIALAQALLDLDSKVPKAAKTGADADDDETPEPRLRKRDVANTAVRATIKQFANLIRAVPATLKMATAVGGSPSNWLDRLRQSVQLAPRTPFNVNISGKRSFAVLSLPIDRVKAVARGFGVSLNDVVLSICAGALREHLVRRKQLPVKPLIVGMPVSLRVAGNAESNNQVSMAQCSLATDVADPVERLRTIAAATSEIKSRVAAFKDLIPTDFPGLAAPIWASGLTRLWARTRVSERLPPLANIVISNVPGPPVDLFLAGARLLHYFPVSIVIHGLALNITLQSYGGNLEFGVIACKDVVPKPDGITKGIARALDALTAKLPA